MWTNAKGAELIEPAKQLFHDVPTPESHIFWYPWRQQQLSDAAISVQGDLYLAAFAGWHDPNEDDHYVAWPTAHMQRMESLSEGIQLADENLRERNARFLTDENAERLERLRAEHDPDGRFHSYLTTSEESW